MNVDCHIDVYRNNAFYRRLRLDRSRAPAINVNNTQNIKMELRALYEEAPEIDLLSDRFRPFILLDGVEYPLGVYLAADAPKSKKIATTRSLTAYDLTYLLQLSKIEERLTIPAGTLYTAAVQQQMISAGIIDFVIQSSNVAIAETREDWEPGTPRLEIVNALLSEINYNSVWANNTGIIQVTKYQQPTPNSIDFIYKNDDASILYPEHSEDLDIFERPNVFRLTCENPEKATLVATSVNDDPASMVSTTNTGRRVLYTEKVNNIASLAELQSKADRLKFESLQSNDSVTIQTGPNPLHSCFNVIAIQKDGLQGIYEEEGWTLELLGAAKMQHKARRLLL